MVRLRDATGSAKRLYLFRNLLTPEIFATLRILISSSHPLVPVLLCQALPTTHSFGIPQPLHTPRVAQKNVVPYSTHRAL